MVDKEELVEASTPQPPSCAARVVNRAFWVKSFEIKLLQKGGGPSLGKANKIQLREAHKLGAWAGLAHSPALNQIASPEGPIRNALLAPIPFI